MNNSAGPAGPRGSTGVIASLPWIGLVVIVVLPPFLLGALAVGVRGDLGFGPAGLGAAVAWFFVTTSLTATSMGQVIERYGVKTGLLIGALSSMVSLAGLGLARNFAWVLAAMTAGGLGNAAIQPSVNAALARTIDNSRLGLAFGLKQGSVPVATLFAGLAIPTVATSIGWRATFGAAALIAAGSAALAARTRSDKLLTVRRSRRTMSDLAEKRSLMLLSLGGLLGGAAASSLGVFLVDSAVEGGIPETQAGLIVAAVSAAGIFGRVGLGWYADTHPARSRWGTIAVLLAVAAPGYLFLTVPTPLPYTIGALIGYMAGWSWPGLFHYAVVSQNPVSPAAATGLVQTGLSMGAGLGPLVFGFVAERAGYDAAWRLAAALAACGAAVVFLGRGHLRRTRRKATEDHVHELAPVGWDDNLAVGVAEGVTAQERETINLEVTLYRLQPHSDYTPPMASRTGVLLVLEGVEVRVTIRGVEVIVAAGDRIALPANRPWQLRNDGEAQLTVARIGHRGNASILQ